MNSKQVFKALKNYSYSYLLYPYLLSHNKKPKGNTIASGKLIGAF